MAVHTEMLSEEKKGRRIVGESMRLWRGGFMGGFCVDVTREGSALSMRYYIFSKR